MKPNKFQVSVILFLKSGNTRKVDWIEDALMKKVKESHGETNAPLELHEAEMFFQGKFKDWKDKGVTIIRKNVREENSVICFQEVEYATFKVEQINDEPKVVKDDITSHPAHPSNYEKKLK